MKTTASSKIRNSFDAFLAATGLPGGRAHPNHAAVPAPGSDRWHLLWAAAYRERRGHRHLWLNTHGLTLARPKLDMPAADSPIIKLYDVPLDDLVDACRWLGRQVRNHGAPLVLTWPVKGTPSYAI